MEETKLVTDTLDRESGGREAFRMGRSFCVSRSGPCGNEDPAKSSNVAGWKSQSPKLQGFASNVHQLAVS